MVMIIWLALQQDTLGIISSVMHRAWEGTEELLVQCSWAAFWSVLSLSGEVGLCQDVLPCGLRLAHLLLMR